MRSTLPYIATIVAFLAAGCGGPDEADPSATEPRPATSEDLAVPEALAPTSTTVSALQADCRKGQTTTANACCRHALLPNTYFRRVDTYVCDANGRWVLKSQGSCSWTTLC